MRQYFLAECVLAESVDEADKGFSRDLAAARLAVQPACQPNGERRQNGHDNPGNDGRLRYRNPAEQRNVKCNLTLQLRIEFRFDFFQ